MRASQSVHLTRGVQINQENLLPIVDSHLFDVPGPRQCQALARLLGLHLIYSSTYPTIFVELLLHARHWCLALGIQHRERQ